MLTDEQMVAAIAPLYAERRVARIALATSRDEYRAIESAACAERDARIAEQDELIARLRLEAQLHAQEARTANATIAEIYQAVTGSTGEPGNWHGAAPVKARIAELTRELEESRKDAEMYRWLRDYHIGDDPESINLKKAKTKGLDAAIDAAIKEQT